MDNQQERQLHNNDQLKNHHRYSRNQDPEYDLDEAEQKHKKMQEYRQQLQEQMNENASNRILAKQNEKNETAAMEEKQQQERDAMREEFEEEHSTQSTNNEVDGSTSKVGINTIKNGNNRRNLSSNIFSIMHTEPEETFNDDSNNRNPVQ